MIPDHEKSIAELAREDAARGLGVEDIVIKRGIPADLARKYVWAAEQRRYAAKLKREAKF